MSRDWKLYLDDIREAGFRIASYTEGMDREAFASDTRTCDAAIRNLEIIGIAIAHLPPEALEAAPEIPWRRIKDMRNLLAHAYFGVDIDIVWDVAKNHVPAVILATDRIRDHFAGEPEEQ